MYTPSQQKKSPFRASKCLGLLLSSLFILLISINKPKAQTLELGLLAGVSNYQGDITSSEFSVILKQHDAAFGGFLRYQFNESFALKLQVVKTELKADDANSSLDFLQQRNLRFFSPLLDGSLQVEWYPLSALSKYQPTFMPYISLGGSFFSFNPQAAYKGVVYELQPLNTEGQGLASFPDRKPYQLYSGSAVGGFGFKYLLNEDLTIGFAFSAHYAFTDYLDDVSSTYPDYNELAFTYGVISADISYQVDDFFNVEQTSPLQNIPRGNPDFNDWFFVLGVTLSYNLVNPERARGGGIGCPTF